MKEKKGKTQRLLGIIALVAAMLVVSGAVVAIAHQNQYGPNSSYDYNGNYNKDGQRHRISPDQNNTYQDWYPCPWMRGYYGYHGGPGYHGWCMNYHDGYGYRHHYNRHYRW